MSGEFVCWKCEKSFPIKVASDNFPGHPADLYEPICNDCYEELAIDDSHAQFVATTYQDNGVTE
jgi:hypothetical protein